MIQIVVDLERPKYRENANTGSSMMLHQLASSCSQKVAETHVIFPALYSSHSPSLSKNLQQYNRTWHELIKLNIMLDLAQLRPWVRSLPGNERTREDL